ncbi:hypothetical protein K7432_002707 [Basidiobolus ranarum]|uniref:Uncharacterized protein n=1 Tax=Basidiobolus ranarum TaxID=34480 RepID=A0ABR2X135_9FUNG
MRFSAFSLVFLSSALLAVAQNNSTCQGQGTMDSCISINKNNQAICDTNPAELNRPLCKCRIQFAVINCYLQCPNDPTAQGQKKIAESEYTTLCAGFNDTQIFATPTAGTPTTAPTNTVPSTGANPNSSNAPNASGKPTSDAYKLTGSSLAIAGIFAALAL